MQHFLFIGPERSENNGPSIFARNITSEIEKKNTRITYISKKNCKEHILKSFNQYDAILINSTSLLPLLYALQITLYKKSHRKILFVLHGEMGKEITNSFKKTLLRGLQNFLLQQSTNIVFVSRMFMLDFFRQHREHENKRHKALIIPNGVEESVKNITITERPIKNTVDIIYVGGTRLEKGFAQVQSLLNLPTKFNGRHVNIHLVGVTGTSNTVTQKNMTTHYYQTLSHADVIDQYNNCDIFLSASQYETYGIAIQEAYSRGCKIVSYEKAGILDLIRKDNSVFSYDQLDPEILHATLQIAIDSEKQQDSSILSTIPTWQEVSSEYLKHLQPQIAPSN